MCLDAHVVRICNTAQGAPRSYRNEASGRVSLPGKSKAVSTIVSDTLVYVSSPVLNLRFPSLLSVLLKCVQTKHSASHKVHSPTYARV